MRTRSPHSLNTKDACNTNNENPTWSMREHDDCIQCNDCCNGGLWPGGSLETQPAPVGAVHSNGGQRVRGQPLPSQRGQQQPRNYLLLLPVSCKVVASCMQVACERVIRAYCYAPRKEKRLQYPSVAVNTQAFERVDLFVQH